MLYYYCVALLLFVLSYVWIVCTVPLPPGVNPIAVEKYINISINNNQNTVVGIATILQTGWSGDRILVGGEMFPFSKISRPFKGPIQFPIK